MLSVEVPVELVAAERLEFIVLLVLLPEIDERLAFTFPPAVPDVGERLTFVPFTLVLELLLEVAELLDDELLDPPLVPLDKEPDAEAPPLDPPDEPDMAYAEVVEKASRAIADNTVTDLKLGVAKNSSVLVLGIFSFEIFEVFVVIMTSPY